MPQELSHLDTVDQEMTKILSTGQRSVSAFDNRVAPLYFDSLTMKMIELDFVVFMPNVYLSLTFKLVQELPQSNGSRCQNWKTSSFVLDCISSFALHVLLELLDIINIHPNMFSIHSL